MALFDRLTAQGQPEKIPVHQFMAAMQEMARGFLTKAQVVAMFSMDASDEAELDQIIARYQTKTTALDRFMFAHAIHDILMLSERDLAYTTRTAVRDRILAI